MPPDHQNAQPLIDNFGRKLDYLRLSVTDQCNLQCNYCRQYTRIAVTPAAKPPIWETLQAVTDLFVRFFGITKLRLTGGEPLVRAGITDFIAAINQQYPALQVHLTSNGVLLQKNLQALRKLHIAGINISLDSLDPERYARITGHDKLMTVLAGLDAALDAGLNIKINSVVQDDMPVSELLALAALARVRPIEVRFIEFMNINRHSRTSNTPNYNAQVIRDLLAHHFPGMVQMENRGGTAQRYVVPDFTGTLGIIAGDSRTFCSHCNRLRITAGGHLKLCLYDRNQFNIYELIEQNTDPAAIAGRIRKVVQQRHHNGVQAQQACSTGVNPDMVEIGG